MTETNQCPIKQWVNEPLSPKVSAVLNRVAMTEDVQYIAVMPDVHLAHDICVGTVIGTSRFIFPEAIGGDIGCGMTAIGFKCSEEILRDEKNAARLFSELQKVIPTIRHRNIHCQNNFSKPLDEPLSHPKLNKLKNRDGQTQLGTLGRGNHFLELQVDDNGELWLMVHSGSRAMGPAIRDHHLTKSHKTSTGLQFLDAESPEGEAFLMDYHWACTYAEESRRAMVREVVNIFIHLFHIEADLSTYLSCQHNQVRRENHFGRELWIHRKGAISARTGERGIIPGSMGSPSYHVEGRGCEDALCSSSHGAGRRLSRTEARKQFTLKQFHREMERIWFDHRVQKELLEEAPSAYKDIGAVMRAQRDLTKIRRRLRPLLSYKGG